MQRLKGLVDVGSVYGWAREADEHEDAGRAAGVGAENKCCLMRGFACSRGSKGSRSRP